MQDTPRAGDGNLRFTAMTGKGKGKGKGRSGQPKAGKNRPLPPETSGRVLDLGSPGEGPPFTRPVPPRALRVPRRGGVFGPPVTVGETTLLPVVSRIRVGAAIRIDRPVGVYVVDGDGHTRWVSAIDVVVLAAVAHAVAALVLVLTARRRRRRPFR